ncbi:MaoC family dehydratase [Kosakonia sacchari]|uniref:MaoC family dehydratase n=1 Tax=Kosakonia sacchari TaxID=1158459 RepID=UPI000BE5EC78|nr:MaoC family dehydratase [Kosakonia sacchari]PDO82024.1 enoyl-CoA hydratase [Kosakonia sacchari]
MVNSIHNLHIGQCAEFKKTLTDNDVADFALASGDTNPVHLDESAGRESIFGQRVVHGILVSGLISAVIANKLPGNGSIYLGQDLKFIKLTFIGDTITATAEVIAINCEKNRVRLKTTCTNQHGDKVIVGEAVVLPPLEKALAEEVN